MIRVEFICAPRQGRQDLDWLAEMTDSLRVIYNFFAHEEAAARVQEEAPDRLMTEEELQRAVEGRVIETGAPFVRMRSGSLILELSQFLDASIGVQALVGLSLLLKKGPEIAALPNRVRAAWFSSAEDAIKARNAYEKIKASSNVDVIEDKEQAFWVALRNVEPEAGDYSKEAPQSATPRPPRPKRGTPRPASGPE